MPVLPISYQTNNITSICRRRMLTDWLRWVPCRPCTRQRRLWKTCFSHRLTSIFSILKSVLSLIVSPHAVFWIMRNEYKCQYNKLSNSTSLVDFLPKAVIATTTTFISLAFNNLSIWKDWLVLSISFFLSHSHTTTFHQDVRDGSPYYYPPTHCSHEKYRPAPLPFNFCVCMNSYPLFFRSPILIRDLAKVAKYIYFFAWTE